MKRNIYLLLISIAILPVLSSCKKIGINTPALIGIERNVITLAGTVTAGTIYQLNLTQYGTSSATILQQASGTYLISEIISDAITGNLFYRYSGSGTAKANGDVTEQVVIDVADVREVRNGRGCQDGQATQKVVNTRITLNLAIK